MLTPVTEKNFVEIGLTQGMVTIVDADDLEIVGGIKWCANRASKRLVYAVSRFGLMHRVIMKPEKGKVVDHINGDGLDNRRMNLRIASHKDNVRNRRIIEGVVPFRGVTLSGRPNKPFIAQIHSDGVWMNLGRYRTAEEAAAAYDAAAIKYFGEFASLNFPATPQESEATR